MADANYPIPESPEYNPNIRALKDSDPAQASSTFNPVFQQIIENTAAVKKQADATDKKMEESLDKGAPKCVVVFVPTGGWTLTNGCYQQTVAVEGLLTSDDQATVRIEPVGSTDAAAQLTTDTAYSLWAAAGGYAACTADGELFCRCPAGGAKPAVDFQIAVCIAR